MLPRYDVDRRRNKFKLSLNYGHHLDTFDLNVKENVIIYSYGNTEQIIIYLTRLHIRFRTRPVPYEFEIVRSTRLYNNIVRPDGYTRARAYVSIEHAAAEHAPRPSAATAVYRVYGSRSRWYFFHFTSFPSTSLCACTHI